MSDNLREALEELLVILDANADAPEGNGMVIARAVADRVRLALAAHPDETTTEWGAATIAVGFDFSGCTGRSDTYCACATWTEEYCSICCEAIEDGQEIYSLTRRGNPALPDDDENQHWEHFFKHAECPEAES